ncbi:NAD(P)-binding domain-containing protein [Leucobacter luti]|uniref:pyrroline-5-carboxylate reductase family protein n=1 Tax=Leucobacter luti TaxID=340320 RepID=UPI002867B8EC|nr:NAD(P)-binding domain-containing protein [Leucobacter luti]
MNAASETPEQPGLPRTAMIGVGSMGGAILQGLRNPSVAITRPIVVTTRSAASAAEYANTTDVTAIALEDDAEANRRAVAGAGLVILAVKPWLLIDAAREIAQALEPGAVVVSVAAGVPSAAIEAVLPAGVAVVRAMPNTPSHIGRGMTGIAGVPRPVPPMSSSCAACSRRSAR